MAIARSERQRRRSNPKPVMPNALLLARYLDDRSLEWRPLTMRQRSYQLRRLIEQFDPTPLVQITRDDVSEWRRRLEGGHENHAAYVSTLRGLCQWMVINEIRPDDPSIHVRRPKIPERPPRPMVERKYQLALACAMDDPEMYLWLGLMGCSGFRCCEVAWMMTSDIEEREDGVALAHIVGKKGKRRTVPIGRNLLLTMRPFLSVRGPVFTKPNGLPYTNSDVSRLTNTFLRGIGIEETAHQLRHRFGTDYHVLDPDLFRQAKVMGHSSVNTTQAYTEVSPLLAAKHIEELTRRRFGRWAAA